MIDQEEKAYKKVDAFIRVSKRCWRDRRKRADDELHVKRQDISRRPENLLGKDHVESVLLHLDQSLNTIDTTSYIEIRRYLSSFLLLTNGRRGGEVHRLRGIDWGMA